MKNLKIEGKKIEVLVLKSLAIYKTLHLSLITTVPHALINQLNNINENFMWNRKNPKIRHSTLSNRTLRGRWFEGR